jgi:ABC-type transport system involved in multi-copper enzyme maturation permease subunit
MNATLATRTPSQVLSPAPLTGRPGVPFARLVRTELRKLTDTRAGKWLLIAITATTPIVVLVMLVSVHPNDLTYDKFVDLTQTPQKVLLPILGVLTITTEWSQRTGLVTFTLAANRGRILLAKATATLLLGLFVIAVAFAAAAIGNVLGAALRNGNGSWSFGASGFRDITILQLTGLAQGLAFGMLLLTTAAAIIAYYLLPSLSSFAVNSIAALKGSKDWYDLNSAQNALYNHDITGRGWAQLLTAVTIWVVLPAVFGVVRVLHSEVK